MSHRVPILCCCLWLFVASRAGATDEDDRVALTISLAHQRFRELAWVTSRAVCLAHARTLEEVRQRADAGVAWLYAGLTELHAGDLASARRSLNRSRELLKDAGEQNSVHAESRRLCDHWRHRMEEQNEVFSVTELLATDDRPSLREVTVWLHPVEKTDEPANGQPPAEPLAYRLLDPAMFTEALHSTVAAWPSASDDWQFTRTAAWRALLLEDYQLAAQVLDKLGAAATSAVSANNLNRHEAECLQFACAWRTGRSENVESSWQGLHEAEWLPLWGLRALSLIAVHEPRALTLAQQTVRAMIGERHPFDSLLLFPQERDRWAKSDWLRDCYWEVGTLHGESSTALHGPWLAFPVAKEFVRSERLLSELKSPLRLGLQSRMTPLRTVTTALACARIGDFESWPGDATGESLPLWDEVAALAREVAGDLRTHSPGQVIDRESETQIEPLEWLLLGTELAVRSSDDGDVAEQGGETKDGVAWRWIQWSAVALLAVVVVAGMRRYSHRG